MKKFIVILSIFYFMIFLFNIELGSAKTTVLCNEKDWVYSLSPVVCPDSGTQLRSWGKIGQCEGGFFKNESETVSCEYRNDCLIFNYTEWSECQESGVRTREVLAASPDGCFGGNPNIHESCVYYAIGSENTEDLVKKNEKSELVTFFSENFIFILTVFCSITLLIILIMVTIIVKKTKSGELNIFAGKKKGGDLTNILKQRVNDRILVLLNKGFAALEKGDKDQAEAVYFELKEICDNNHSLVEPDYYNGIKDFYNYIIKLHYSG